MTRTARKPAARRLSGAATEGAAAFAGRARPLLVVVLGMHRSGTSLCAHLLNALGVDMADHPLPLSSNPMGHWERWEIVGFHNRILELFDRGYETPLHDLALPSEWWADPRVTGIRREIVAFLGQRMATGVPFGFKDPRTARLLPLWRQIFGELDREVKIIVCLRNPAQVARSLNERDGLPPDIGEYRWFTYMAELYGHIDNDDFCPIEYEKWFDDSGDNATKLVRFLGLAKSPTEIIAAAAEIVDRNLRHDDPVLREAAQPLPWSLYEAARRLDIDPAARGDIRRIVDQSAAFRSLRQGIEGEFEQLSRMAVDLLQPAGGAGKPIVSWRDPRIEDAWRKIVSAAGQTGGLEQQLKTALRQRSELDVALARAQQAAALRHRAAQAAEQELAALRRRFGISTAAEIARPAPSVRTPLALGATPSPVVVEEIIDAVIERGDPELIDRTIQLRGGEAEFRRLLASKLFEAGFLDHARRAAVKAAVKTAQSLPTEGHHYVASGALQMPIFFRHQPMVQHAEDLVLWYRSDHPGEGVAPSNRVRAFLRWFDCNERILVWQSEPIILNPTESRYWQPVLVPVPVSPRQTSWLRFDVLAANQDQIEPLGTGFLFVAGGSDLQPAARRDILACTHARQPAVPPGEITASSDGQRWTDRGTDFSTGTNRSVLIETDALADTEMLVFVDWGCFGRRLATVLIPPPALSGARQLLLPTSEPGARLFGLSRASGIVPIKSGHAPE